jgi:hypothetical protein
MNLYDAYVILLEATIDQDDDAQIRNARKRVAKKVEAMRVRREREAKRRAGVATPQEEITYVPAWIEPFPGSN